nr:zinc-binding dehydrogenase [Nocardioides convexus]
MVFEHPGRETFGASVYVTRKGGTITTCASTTGYMHEYDNRYLWMNLKRIISSHFANYRESWEANRLIAQGKIHPTLSRTYKARGHRPGRPRRAPQQAPGQGRRAVPLPRGGSRRARRGACGRSTSTRSTCSAASEADLRRAGAPRAGPSAFFACRPDPAGRAGKAQVHRGSWGPSPQLPAPRAREAPSP